MNTTAIPLVLAGALALGACSSAKEAAAPTPSAAPATPTPTPAACLTVSAALLSAIAEGTKPGAGRLRITDGAAVPASGFSHVFLVAAHISAPGVHEVGVWTSVGLTPGNGSFLAVDGFARRFTKWPEASGSAAHISAGDPGVRAARACL